MALPFSKYHGLGNDFVLLESSQPFQPDLVQRICDRNRGVGGDGILFVSPHPSADAQMIIFNADGTRPEMCGNGLRCVAFHVAAKSHHHPTSVNVTIATDAGPKDCLVALEPDNPEAVVRIDLGPVAVPSHRTITCHGLELDLITTSVGNPHAILLQPAVEFERFAPTLATHPDFPHGANISFVEPGADQLRVRVWERGAGPTLACGTAACAVAAVAVHERLAAQDTPIRVQLPGGTLEVVISQDNHAIMTGPARHVFDGTLISLEPDYSKPLDS